MLGTVNELPHLSAAFLGNTQSGKSTLIASLQAALQSPTEAGVFSQSDYYMSLHRLKEERETSIQAYMKLVTTENLNLTLLDVPGNSLYTKNMIVGVSLADIGVMIASAREGEFEEGIKTSGETRELFLLSFTMGIKRLIICCNKMDDQGFLYNEKRFTEIVTDVSTYCRKVGYNPNNIPFIPISSLLGDNLVARSENMPWYTGPTLLEAINMQPIPERLVERPLRMAVSKSFYKQGVGTICIGKVHFGRITTDTRLTATPHAEIGKAMSIKMHGVPREAANSGDLIGLCLRGNLSRDVKRGSIISEMGLNSATEVGRITAQFIMLNHPGKLKVGYTPVAHFHTASFPCRIEKLETKIHRRTGRIEEEHPEAIMAGDAALIVLTPLTSVSVDTFSGFTSYGRFCLRDSRRTVGVGVVKEIKSAADYVDDLRMQTV